MLVGVQPFHHKNQQKLMDNILWKDLTFPDVVSKDAKDLISKLLERNPSQRLGAGQNGVSSIKKHKFFKSIDWERLYKREVTAPFIPKTKSQSDYSNFDKQFTNLRVDESERVSSRSVKEKESTYIRDFTYYKSQSEVKEEIDINKILEINLERIQESEGNDENEDDQD